jgi:amino acid adenylation domain-containing protein
MNSAVLFLENTAEKFGGRTAFECGDETVTFRELRSRAVSLGTYIIENNGGGGFSRPIMVYLPKSISAVVSFMGILYSGNIYVPLDYAIPLTRLQKIIENLNPLYIITDEDGQARMRQNEIEQACLLYNDIIVTPANESAVFAAVSGVLDIDPIYIMYTSGSTGTPKGVVIPHRGVIDYARWVTETFRIDENTVMGNQAPFYFDNSVLDIYSCLSVGAKVIIIPETLFMFPVKIPEFLAEKEINFIFFVPTVMINIANSGILSEVKMPGLKKALFCGEIMPNRQLNIWRKAHPDALYANLYGPTEITDVCAYYIVGREFSDSDPLPIGRACENMGTVILKEDGTEAPPGEIGELCVMGSGLALGYWNAPEITAKAFTYNQINKNFPERIYKTGDLAYIDAETGLIMYVGRMDSQIKLKGNRIELGDIEVAVKSTAGIDNACVLFDANAQEIVAFAETDGDINLRQMNLRLKELIPKYMLPGKLVKFEKLPLTPNGKIDRVSLRNLL